MSSRLVEGAREIINPEPSIANNEDEDDNSYAIHHDDGSYVIDDGQ